MKILIVSGFLGAGKTTFIKALAKHTGKEFAILEMNMVRLGLIKTGWRQNLQAAL